MLLFSLIADYTVIVIKDSGKKRPKPRKLHPKRSV